MILTVRKNTYLFILLVISSRIVSFGQEPKSVHYLKTGADQIGSYLPILKGKKIAIVANQTSVIFDGKKTTHLIDTLVSLELNIKKVFAPEHGFRGNIDAGESIEDELDVKTKLPIISLYGKNKKPTKSQLRGINLVLFDIQDVGVRFYTYISTLHYVMEACAELNIPLILLDRPNPNGHYIDGPVLENDHKSFVGMHPVPVVYGMTIGEYGQMINGEKWLKDGIKSPLTVIKLKNYTHDSEYRLPIKPSPNLPNEKSINLYPSLCFFEGTNVSVGRGTDMQFQIYGSPFLNTNSKFSFTPSPNEGAKYPKHAHMIVYGEDLRATKRQNTINLSWRSSSNLTVNSQSMISSFSIASIATEGSTIAISTSPFANSRRVKLQGNIVLIVGSMLITLSA